MELWSERERRWCAIGVTVIVLVLAVLAVGSGKPGTALVLMLAAPFVAAAGSGHNATATVAIGFATPIAVLLAFSWFSLAEDGPGLTVALGLIAAAVLRFDNRLQLGTRLCAAFLGGFAAWVVAGAPVDTSSFVLGACMPAVVVVGLADEVFDFFATRYSDGTVGI